jgi:hypothetical protein
LCLLPNWVNREQRKYVAYEANYYDKNGPRQTWYNVLFAKND